MKKILETVKKENVKFIQLQFMDIIGAVKSITIPSSQLEKAIEEGIFFDGSSVVGYATIEESDMRLKPDPDSFGIIPWLEDEVKTAFMDCEVYNHKNERFDGDPRFILSQQLDKAKKLGWNFITAPEYEFFYFTRDERGNPTNIPADDAGYFDLMCDGGDIVRKKTVNVLNALNFDVEASHHEVAPGQHEIDLKYTTALRSADRVAMMKYVTKSIAAQHNLFASFMPKPIQGINGSGMHTHLSLMTDEGVNIFHDTNDKFQLSKYAYYFIGGLIKYAKETCSIFASSVNSYKRLVPGYEAPVYISWANRNRSTFIRVPAARGTKTRIEIRSPDPAGNPYLQFAVMLAAGLKGIEEQIEPPNPVEKDIYHMDANQRAALGIDQLPNYLEALEHLKTSTLLRETLGEHLFHHFIHIKTQEWNNFNAHISEWELANLLPIL